MADALSRLHENDNNDMQQIKSITSENNTTPAVDETSIDKREEMKLVHQLGHCGAKCMVRMLQNQGMQWKGMHKDCKQHVASCLQCCKVDWSGNRPVAISPVLANTPWDHVQIDLISDLPHHGSAKYVLVLVDVFSGFTILRPLTSKHAKKVANVLLDIFWDFGFPKILQSDNGKEFTNRIITELLKYLNIEHRLSTRYHPEANGKVERTNRTVLNTLKKVLQENEDWTKVLGRIQFSINQQERERTGLSPHQLFTLRKPTDSIQHCGGGEIDNQSDEKTLVRIWIEKVNNSEKVWKAFAKMDHVRHKSECEQIDKLQKAKERLPEGTMVFVQDPETKEKTGPFEIEKVTTGGKEVQY